MGRKVKVIVPVLLAMGAVAVPSANGASTKTCIEEGKNKNWTETVEQRSACPSASNNNEETVAVTNGGGHQPGGQQP